MKLSVSHRTVYTFDAPVHGVVQSLRMQPVDCDSQRVLNWNIAVEGGQLGAGFRDGAGDWVQTVSMRTEVESLTLDVSGIVETTDRNGVLTGHRELVRPVVYLWHTRATDADQAIRDLAAGAVAGEDNALGRAHALARAVAAAVAYRPGETNASTSAAEALDQGVGVCQDHAHVLIAAAISLDIPARYVSGYLYSGNVASMVEASHAWAELHVEGLGWIGFDPANECCPDERYIRLGSGFDAVDAAPIRGLALGNATEHLDVEVNVGQVQQ